MDIESTVPNKVDLGLVWFELDCGIDLDGGAVVDGGHFAAVHGGVGGEEVDVKRAREEW